MRALHDDWPLRRAYHRHVARCVDAQRRLYARNPKQRPELDHTRTRLVWRGGDGKVGESWAFQHVATIADGWVWAWQAQATWYPETTRELAVRARAHGISAGLAELASAPPEGRDELTGVMMTYVVEGELDAGPMVVLSDRVRTDYLLLVDAAYPALPTMRARELVDFYLDLIEGQLGDYEIKSEEAVLLHLLEQNGFVVRYDVRGDGQAELWAVDDHGDEFAVLFDASQRRVR